MRAPERLHHDRPRVVADQTFVLAMKALQASDDQIKTMPAQGRLSPYNPDLARRRFLFFSSRVCS
jgi:hypothetical protein